MWLRVVGALDRWDKNDPQITRNRTNKACFGFVCFVDRFTCQAVSQDRWYRPHRTLTKAR